MTGASRSLPLIHAWNPVETANPGLGPEWLAIKR